ncbi:MAG: sensor histidine kinase [Anaerobacillus sp.]|uniref:cache domain-containing sensor histidine kinase n=1 Tax=Anaerobacillus sp. TaxID=1872506 RepID=UPI00391C25BC
MLKILYSNLRIKYKLFLLISFITLAFSVGGISILQYAFQVYNEEIYRQSAQSLSITSTSIENELMKLERLSFNVSTDQEIQQYLTQLKNSETDYQQYIVGRKVRKRLSDLGSLNKYVSSVQVYDVHDNEYASGNKIVVLPDERIQKVKEDTQIKKGGVQWIFPDEDDPSLIIGREVRSYSHLALPLEHLGTMIVRINMQEIANSFSNRLAEKGSKLLILDDSDHLFYPLSHETPEGIINIKRNDSRGFKLIQNSDERFFITYSTAKHTNWTYMIVTPYSNLFEAISKVRNAVLITYSLMFVIILILAMRFASGITNPIESLNKKMKRIETGDLESDNNEYLTFPNDETGQMHYNFKVMMDQINFLMQENYRKLILIKDSEYKTLQAQVNPHFLYNTLESINWAAKMKGHHQISKMAEALGYILRSSINMKETLITLEEELRIVESYITIQSVRFEERLSFHIDIPKSIYTCTVPKFILQPLVDNSIKYGLEQIVGTIHISLYCEVENNYIVLTIEDDGPGIKEELVNGIRKGDYESNGNGIGLKNVHERIQILFGEQYGIQIESQLQIGTKIHIRLPNNRGDQNVQSATSG